MEIHGLFTPFVDHFPFHRKLFSETMAFEVTNYIQYCFLCCILVELKRNLCTLSSSILSSSGSICSWFIRISLTELVISTVVSEDWSFGNLKPKITKHEHLEYCFSRSVSLLARQEAFGVSDANDEIFMWGCKLGFGPRITQ